MTAVKLAISLPPDAVARARAAVREGRAASVSAYVADAIAEKAKLEDLESLLETMLEESGGPLTAAERREVDRLARRGGRPGVRRPRSRR